MSAVRARFDGKVFVPQGPVDLAEGEAVTLTIRRDRAKKKPKNSALDRIVARGVTDDLPADLGYQHDHYLYGMLKKTEMRNPNET